MMRIEQITFTRFVAAISIVVFHYGRNVFPFNHPSISFLFQQAAVGVIYNVGVSYFFTLSGLVMIVAYHKNPFLKPVQYYTHRFARIYPVYLLAIVLLLLIELRFNDKVDYHGMLLNVLVIQSWIPPQALSFNYTGWSLSVEVLFYAIFPLLFNFIYRKKTALKYCTIPIILIFVLSQFFFLRSLSLNGNQVLTVSQHGFLYFFPLLHLNEFLVGNLAGLFLVTTLKNSRKNYDWSILAVIGLIVIALKFPLGLNFHNGLLCLLFVPLLLLLALNKGTITAIFNNKILVFLGEMSFGIYILQFPVFKFMIVVCNHFLIKNPAVVFYLSAMALLLVSAISYTFFETPMRNLIKKIFFKSRNLTPKFSEKQLLKK